MDAENIKSGSSRFQSRVIASYAPSPYGRLMVQEGALFHRKKGFNRHKKIMSHPDSIISVPLKLAFFQIDPAVS
jgi:hypothetical protein